MRFGIIAAVSAEARPFPRDRGRFLGSHDYLLITGGPGPDNAARAAARLLSEECDVLLSWGVAGALDAALEPGDVVVSSCVSDAGGRRLDFSPATAQRLCSTLKPRPLHGTVCGMRRPIAAAAEKAALHARLDCTVVDMESAAIAAAAMAANRDFTALRAIVDPAAMSLPAAALTGINDDGSMNPLAVAAAVCRRPYELPALLRLAAHFRRAVAALGRCATQLTA